MTKAELEELCRYWKDVLRLRDWDVRVALARIHDMEPGRQGECLWNLRTKQAFIRVLDASDWDDRIPWKQDQEQTLVHELLHLHFAPFSAEPDSAEDVAQEQAINALAWALVELRRGMWKRVK